MSPLLSPLSPWNRAPGVGDRGEAGGIVQGHRPTQIVLSESRKLALGHHCGENTAHDTEQQLALGGPSHPPKAQHCLVHQAWKTGKGKGMPRHGGRPVRCADLKTGHLGRTGRQTVLSSPAGWTLNTGEKERRVRQEGSLLKGEDERKPTTKSPGVVD